jgi:Leu/Phe-tRNA-protein transferase
MSVAYRIANIPGLFSEGVDPGEPTPLLLRASREATIGESVLGRLARLARVSLATFEPRRLVALPAYVELMLRERAVGAATLPDAASALTRPEGFCGAAIDLAPATLVQAYAQGLHARAPASAASWWSPPTRLMRDLRAPAQAPFVEGSVFDTDSDAIVARCAAAAMRRDAATALTPDLKRAHLRLLDRGYAHSWRAGGAEGYGLVIGGVFIVLGVTGDKATARRGLVALEQELRRRRFSWLDVSFVARATGRDFGVETPRAAALESLAQCPDSEGSARWR